MEKQMLTIKELVKLLLDNEALLFGDFTLKSGKKSPFYFNIAKAIKNGEGFAKISLSLAGYIYANFLEHSVPANRKLKPETIFLFGAAYKGIPLVSGVAYALIDKFDVNIRWGYNRKEDKEYGDSADRFIIGDLRDGDNLIIIDDVITTGLTKVEIRDKIIKTTKYKNLNFAATIALIDRFEGTTELRNDLKIFGVIRADHMIEICKENNWISAENYNRFKEYFNK
ncbi:MAG: orotate phosphoribosyltransferase [Promethearchaeota archaeon]